MRISNDTALTGHNLHQARQSNRRGVVAQRAVPHDATGQKSLAAADGRQTMRRMDDQSTTSRRFGPDFVTNQQLASAA
jgi:hypothetical protein